MIRIVGIDLPNNKHLKYALTSIYGIGISTSEKILRKVGFDSKIQETLKAEDLSDNEISILRKILEEEYQLENDLRRFQALNIKRLIETGSIRGRRHRANLPVRGQRTRTNARTRKGIKKTVPGKKK
jgi:small subunit ribosomal protein S13